MISTTASLAGDARRERRAADLVARQHRRELKIEAKRRERALKAEDRRQAQVARAAARAARWGKVAAAAGRLRPVAPLVLVTGFAMFGQIEYGLSAYSSPQLSIMFRLAVAVGAAVAVESIGLYVQWHAHDAYLLGATSTAAWLRRASYAIALAVAAVNYAHFSDGLAPTPAAVVFALFSASGPWLWGLHTRRVLNIQLRSEGLADTAGARFGAERFRAFPLRTIGARRWSIDHGVTDPREAWEGYREFVAGRREMRREIRERMAGGTGRTFPGRWGKRWRGAGWWLAWWWVIASSPATSPTPSPISPAPSPTSPAASPAPPPALPLGGSHLSTPDPPALREITPGGVADPGDDDREEVPGEVGSPDATVEDAAWWGATEIAAGRTAGWRRIQGKFPHLTDHFARLAAERAKKMRDENPIARLNLVK